MKRQEKVFKAVEKRLKDIKEGKVTRYKSVDDMFKELDENRKRHKIYYSFYDPYRRVVNYLNMLPLRIKSFIQRGKRGWAYCDTWRFDNYIAEVISEALEHLKNNHCGVPTYEEGKSSKQAEKEWNAILKHIINTFNIATKIIDGQLYYVSSKEWTKENYKKFKKLYDNKKKNKEFFRPMTLKEVIEYEEGFDLFKEWFFALWD